MDHRATDQARRINETHHEVLRYVGGVISPEMQTPKLLWMKEASPRAWTRAARFLDLPDFLVYRATGNDVRSLCTTVCKWTYLGHAGGRVAARLLPTHRPGRPRRRRVRAHRDAACARWASARARSTRRHARELGLAPGTPVAVAIIDAHAGGLGVPRRRPSTGAARAKEDARATPRAHRRHVDVPHGRVARASLRPRRVGAVLLGDGPRDGGSPRGGNRRTGALLDHVDPHRTPAAPRSCARPARRRRTVCALLNERLDALARGVGAPFPAALARDLHVLPDHHGNRSPRADPTLRGMISGLKLDRRRSTRSRSSTSPPSRPSRSARATSSTRCAPTATASTTLVATGGDTKNPRLPARARRRDRLPRRPAARARGGAARARRCSARWRAGTARRSPRRWAR